MHDVTWTTHGAPTQQSVPDPDPQVLVLSHGFLMLDRLVGLLKVGVGVRVRMFDRLVGLLTQGS